MTSAVFKARSAHNCRWAAYLARGREWTQIFEKYLNEWIPNCLIIISVRLDQNPQFWARKLEQESDPCRSPKILGQRRGRKKDLAEGQQSH